MSNSLFIDIGSCQRQKDGEDCFGDTIYSKKIPEETRTATWRCSPTGWAAA